MDSTHRAPKMNKDCTRDAPRSLINPLDAPRPRQTYTLPPLQIEDELLFQHLLSSYDVKSLSGESYVRSAPV